MDQKQVYSTKMSEGGKDSGSGRSPQNLADTIADNFIAKLRPLLLDFMDQKQFHSTKMSQGGEDSQKAPDEILTEYTTTIGRKIIEGDQKTNSLFSSACIYRVPKELRKLNESAYTPRLIAIGPLHRKDKHLQTPIQHVKSSYTNNLFSRLTKEIKDGDEAKRKKFDDVLQECVVEMKKSIDDAKKCYAEEVTLNEEMLLVDGCFILELLYRNKLKRIEEEKRAMKGGDRGKSKQPLAEEGGSQSSNKGKIGDPLHSLWNTIIVKQDLLLLENQIPYFVLEKLFKLTVAKIQACPCKIQECPCKIQEYLRKSLNDYVSSYFCDKMSSEENPRNSVTTSCCFRRSPTEVVLNCFGNEIKNSEDDVHHILHKLHEDYIPHKQMKTEEDEELECTGIKFTISTGKCLRLSCHKQMEKEKHRELIMPSASDLEYAGIKFIRRKKNNIFNVKFKENKGVSWWCRRAHFKIPHLKIDDSTETFFRNHIAFEQCHPQASQQFTGYAYLMDKLVNSKEDIKVLENAGILSNHLGDSEDATILFNKLCKEIVVQLPFIFKETRNKATEYSLCPWPKYMADLKRTYFASPWTFIAFCVGFIAFGVSITQFVLSFLK